MAADFYKLIASNTAAFNRMTTFAVAAEGAAGRLTADRLVLTITAERPTLTTPEARWNAARSARPSAK